MFSEPPEVLLCELLLVFVKRVTTEDSEIDAYMRYCAMTTRTRDAIKRVKSNKDVDNLFYMSESSSKRSIELVTSRKG